MTNPGNLPGDLPDDLIERLHEEGSEAALHAWGPGGSSARCPYPERSQEAEIWWYSFRNTYARDNGY